MDSDLTFDDNDNNEIVFYDDSTEDHDKTVEDAESEDDANGAFGAMAEEEEEEDEDGEADIESSDDDDKEEVRDFHTKRGERASDSSSEEETEQEKQRKKSYFSLPPSLPETPITSFSSLNLSRPILKGLSILHFVTPTPIQSQTIPVALMGKDICGGAITGSGKTAAFVVPILERLLYKPREKASTRVLILCPTRELAIQVDKVARTIGQFVDVSFCLCIGGLSLKPQETELRQRPDIVIATPGRLIDHVRNSPSFSLDSIEILVIDEADRMLENGFAAELDEIIKFCPKSRQTMLFSATMTDNVDELIRLSLNHPVRLVVDSVNSASSKLIQEFVRIREHREKDRAAVMLALCSRTFKHRVIIFFKIKVSVHKMKIVFDLMGLKAGELHGSLSQEQRLQALEAFRKGRVDFLLATDLASRGLDIKGIETVINYDMPQTHALYLHRVGRTARAGRNGRSVSLTGESDRKILKKILRHTPHSHLKRRVISPEIISTYQDQIDSLQDRIKQIFANEREQNVIQRAEMELQKSENMLIHQEEIMSRPARTWFISEKQKKLASGSGGNEKKKIRDKYAGMPRAKKRRLKSMEEEDAIHKVKNAKSIKVAKKALRPSKITKLPPESQKVGGGAIKKKGKSKKTEKRVRFDLDLADVSKKSSGAVISKGKKKTTKLKSGNSNSKNSESKKGGKSLKRKGGESLKKKGGKGLKKKRGKVAMKRKR
ncbi:11487_t:CDS:2 [Paraglomus brasilianum]|uniref:RNA helicase n=1 Tax=Paraglomus brasilianum TaxID=144538 RepID=A0A9N9C751_9GLOM|nr:11487_t:CDS:2 [Paraglomus brasilianum]